MPLPWASRLLLAIQLFPCCVWYWLRDALMQRMSDGISSIGPFDRLVC
jgi:hypothetical protein